MGLGSGIRDPGSGKKTYSRSRIPDAGPEVKKAPDPGSGFATLIRYIVLNFFQNICFMEAGLKNFLGGFTVSAGGGAILHRHLLADVAPPADLLAARPLLV